MASFLMKLFFAISNSFVVLIGLSLTAGGVFGVLVPILLTAAADGASFDYQYDTSSMTSIGIVSLTMGITLVVFGFLGFCGCCAMSSCLLTTYVIMIGLATAGQISMAIASGVVFPQLDPVKADNMTQIVETYDPNDSQYDAWDTFQSTLECCGSTSWEDYSSNPNLGTKTIPDSCCKDENEIASCQMEAGAGNEDSGEFYTQGCYDASNDWLNWVKGMVVGLTAGLAGVPILAIVFALCLRSSTVAVDVMV